MIISGDTDGYGFSTKPLDAATGLNYYSYRWYSPVDGRWLNRDPIAERGGLNLYGFVVNDSIGRIDIVGLSDKTDNCNEGRSGKVVIKESEAANGSALSKQIDAEHGLPGSQTRNKIR